ncbi:hypothetical protein B0H34DRAFT_675888 [Crassisporium funariophilum]|nr:hypothetical protein B0H34DRAFT_675888 [Crassisporium funariophilum]
MLRSPSRVPSSTGTSPPTSPSKRSRLGISGVANLFIRLRRHQDKATSPAETVLTSGEPKSHPGVKEGAQDQKQVSVEYIDQFVCAGGVNVTTLLRATRAALLERVDRLGADSLVDEQWECTISGPKPVHSGLYKVQVRYSAAATKSSVSDSHRPVSLDKAKGGIPGLMTIVRRNDA